MKLLSTLFALILLCFGNVNLVNAKYFDFLYHRPSWLPTDKECPTPSSLNHYIKVPAFHDLKKYAQVENIPGLRLHEELQQENEG